MKTAFSSKTYPISAQFVKDFREVFGPDVRVILVDENGVHHGTDERKNAVQPAEEQ